MLNPMKILWPTVCLIAATALCLSAARTSAAADEGFVPLFDGKSLAGWEGNQELWKAREGMIVGKTAGLKVNEFLCTTEKFKDFELRLDVQVVGGKGNSGIQFRSERVANSTEVSGYQADVGDIIGWGALYDESRRNAVLASPDPVAVRADLKKINAPIPVADNPPSPDLAKLTATLKEDGWNSMTIRAVGDHIVIKINDCVAVDYHEQDSKYTVSGIIGLQVHSGPATEVRFRNIQIKKLGGN
ncbi:MAG: 3-keto-disaccharide hydrolase [Planctomycetaceae bacterium]